MNMYMSLLPITFTYTSGWLSKSLYPTGNGESINAEMVPP